MEEQGGRGHIGSERGRRTPIGKGTRMLNGPRLIEKGQKSKEESAVAIKRALFLL